MIEACTAPEHHCFIQVPACDLTIKHSFRSLNLSNINCPGLSSAVNRLCSLTQNISTERSMSSSVEPVHLGNLRDNPGARKLRRLELSTYQCSFISFYVDYCHFFSMLQKLTAITPKPRTVRSCLSSPECHAYTAHGLASTKPRSMHRPLSHILASTPLSRCLWCGVCPAHTGINP
jgi:hypothetical protein